jgi:hypothetical protein
MKERQLSIILELLNPLQRDFCIQDSVMHITKPCILLRPRVSVFLLLDAFPMV